ncbi:lipopolysaccharide biosynthesis protein [Candidatus Calescamantes bacterium]|nr:lipopolysaccharide biosynthesis protein [Candidatus Calescamantes bacterium]
MDNTGLKKKVVRGTFWVFISQIITQALALIKNIILARILSPDDFGLFGIALVVFSLLEAFSRSGFDVALIQKKEDIRDYLDTAFVVNIGRGVVLFLLLFFSAPLVATFFKRAEIVGVVRAVSIVFLLNGFVNPGTIYFSRELEFKKQFQWDMSKSISDIIITLSLVFFLRNVWVLVIGMTASFLTRVVVSYFIHPYRPAFSFNPVYARSLFRFGKWVLGSGILIYLITQGDDAFVGKFLGVTALGFYRIAYRFSNLPATHITHVISRVTFPMYSKLQDDIPKLREAYLKVLQITAFLAFPLAGLIFILAPDFTRIFLGEKWLPMVPAMQVLCIFGVIRALSGAGGSVVLAIGKPKFTAYFTAIQLFILALIIYPLTIKYGILGTAIAVTLSTSIVIITGQIVIIFKSIDVKIRQVLNLLSPIFLAAVIPIGFIFVLKNIIKDESNFWIFLIFILFYIVSFLILFNKLCRGKILIILRRYKEIFLYDSK